MKILYNIAIILSLISIIIGCERDKYSESDPNQAVVEGFIFPGHTAEIKINKQRILSSVDTTMLPITGLSIKLTNVSTDEYEILNDMGEGVYTSENMGKALGSNK